MRRVSRCPRARALTLPADALERMRPKSLAKTLAADTAERMAETEVTSSITGRSDPNNERVLILTRDKADATMPLLDGSGRENYEATYDSKLINTKMNERGEIINPMDQAAYDIIVNHLNQQGIDVFPVTDGDDLRYMLKIGAEATYSQGRISHIGEIPSRGSLFEELIHLSQERQYGEMDLGDYEELFAREIEANRKLLRNRKAYKLDDIDIADIERNLKGWEKSFFNLMGVEYDDSDYR